MNKSELGKLGEELAVKHIKSLGYKILARNWRFSYYEIDIVAKDKNEIVFIEVKTRKDDLHGLPEFAVSKRKQQKISEAAEAYVHEFRIDKECRFDVVAIIYNKQKSKLYYTKDAFFPGVY